MEQEVDIDFSYLISTSPSTKSNDQLNLLPYNISRNAQASNSAKTYELVTLSPISQGNENANENKKQKRGLGTWIFNALKRKRYIY